MSRDAVHPPPIPPFQPDEGRVLLDGYRGHPAVDKEALGELLLRISQLVENVPEIREIDVNPLEALPPREGHVVPDARVRVPSVDRASG